MKQNAMMKTVAKTTATGDFKPVTLITKHNMNILEQQILLVVSG